jgi:seryl-tRNA synthetase
VHDLKWIRENPAAFDAGLARRKLDPLSPAILKLDEERRANTKALQDMQARRNAASKEIGKAKGKGGDPAKAEALMAEVAELKEKIAAGEAAERDFDGKMRDLLAGIPNLLADDVPDGPDESANVELRKWGKPRNFKKEGFEPKEHFELGQALGLMDFEAAAKMSGARFTVLKGALARLERALGQFMLDTQTEEHGFTEVNPPLLVRDQAMFGTGQLPKFAEDLYSASNVVVKEFEVLKVKRDAKAARARELQAILSNSGTPPVDGPFFIQEISANEPQLRGELLNLEGELPEIDKRLKYLESRVEGIGKDSWLIPTSEVPLTNLVRENILAEADLPYRFTALTPCFRAEAGAAGRDTRGMIRQHQFYKVEMVAIAAADKSWEEHERMTGCAEAILKKLGLPYRVIVLCSGDTGFGSRKTHDLEVWLPGQDAYREISSCSNCGDFQARRMQARYRPTEGKDIQYVHTLNGSGLAVGRTLIAVMENYQQKDGSIRVPEALAPYMGGLEVIAAK